MRSLVLAALILAATPVQAQQQHAGHKLGTVDFPISCNAEAQRQFNVATAWLHSFEYEEAQNTYLAAATADPRCAMAQWGVAMSNLHPLWAPPSPAELRKGANALDRARLIGATTKRERDFIEALSVFYSSADKLDHGTRTLAYSDKMERLHRSYPADEEAAVFYALALIAAGTIDDDKTYARETSAAKILNRVLARHPNHPGVAHYLIHGYDYPALAHLALPAARAYAGIAPASAHAQHMPSHIFTRLGLWDESIRSNLAAEAAAKAYATAHGMAGAWDEQLHAIDYLVYGYLQLNQERNARSVLERMNAIQRVDPPNFKVASTFSAVPARFVLERRRWDEAAALELSPSARKAIPWDRFTWAEANIHFARAIGAAHNGDIAAARLETDRLQAIREQLPAKKGEYDWGKQVEIQRQIAAAWLAGAEGRPEQAITLMREAATLDEATEKHPVTPGAILPAREQVGELMLAFGRPAEALAEFEASLRRTPGRYNSILGAAQAAKLSGNIAKARLYRSMLRMLGLAHTGKRRKLRDAEINPGKGIGDDPS